jgi:hypothetical protein
MRWGKVSVKLAMWAAGAVVRREATPKPPPSPAVLKKIPDIKKHAHAPHTHFSRQSDTQPDLAP